MVALLVTLGLTVGNAPKRAVTEPGAARDDSTSHTSWPRGASGAPGSLTVAVKEPVALRGGAVTPLRERSLSRIGLSPGSLTAAHTMTVTEPEGFFSSSGKVSSGDPVSAGMEPPVKDGSASGSVTATSHGLYRHHSAAYYAWIVRRQGREIRSLKAKLRRRWQPTVEYALRLASAATGVSYWQLRSVAWCESRFDPFAVNGRYKGLMQLSWSPLGFSPFDPVANVLSAALTVRQEGSWRRWECSP